MLCPRRVTVTLSPLGIVWEDRKNALSINPYERDCIQRYLRCAGIPEVSIHTTSLTGTQLLRDIVIAFQTCPPNYPYPTPTTAGGPMSTLKPSETHTFESGAIRDKKNGKGRFDLLSPFAAMRRAIVAEWGAANRGPRNWEKGIPLSRVLDSVLRHVTQYVAGDNSEDHLAQASFWLDAAMHYEVLCGAGKLPSSIIDIGPHKGFPVVIPPPTGDKSFRTFVGDEFYLEGCRSQTTTDAVEILQRRYGKPVRLDATNPEHLAVEARDAERAASKERRPGDCRLYISGPLSNPDPKVRAANIENASAVAQFFLKRGFKVVCPHTMSDTWDGKVERQAMLDNDFDIIRNWATHVIVVCDGETYQKSSGDFSVHDLPDSDGTRCELVVAEAAGKPILRVCHQGARKPKGDTCLNRAIEQMLRGEV